MTLPRGIANNNPTNIRRSDTVWAGQSPDQTDPDFVQFVDPRHGLRAGMKTLMAYQHVHGLNTVKQIISRWAPSVENDTSAYVEDVANRCGVGPDTPLSLDDANVLARLTQAIVRHENGPCPTAPGWYPDQLYIQAATDAGASDNQPVA